MKFTGTTLPALRPHDVVLIVGKRGTGKSNAGKTLLAAELKRGARVLAFDPHDEYSVLGRKSDEVRLGSCRDRLSVAALAVTPEKLDDKKLSLAVVPEGLPSAVAKDFAQVVDVVQDTGRLVFLVEEVGMFSEHVEENVNHLACQSRHWSVACVLLAQRMVQIPKTARTQASMLVSFRQDNPDDVAALEKIAGPEFAARVSCLPRGRCEVWRDSLN